MAPNEVVSDLLLRWEELRCQGQNISPEDLCRDCPEQLAELRHQLDALLRVYRVVEAPDPENETLPPRQRGADVVTTLTWKPRPPSVPSAAALSGAPSIPGYEILAELGRGGMGVVYKARQIQLDRVVALKMILAGDDAEDQVRARFQAEARAVARLRHPNIVQIYEVGEHNGQPFFALEFVEGGSLAQAVASGQWPVGSKTGERQAADLVATLAGAVQHAHNQGVLHRDLKPANVLLASGGCEPPDAGSSAASGGLRPPLAGFVPKITDFGLAKVLGRNEGLTQTGAVLGTPNYMSPEQAAGSGTSIGPATDVFALGAILYQLLTGRPPYRGNLLEVLQQASAGRVDPPRQHNPRVSAELDRICRKALEPDPKRRYARAEELAADLRRFLYRPRRLRRALLAGAAAVLVLALTAVFLLRPSDGDRRKIALLQDDGLVLRIWSAHKITKRGKRVGVDPGALPARPNDRIRVEVRLNEPAYVYLLMLDARGEVTPLYPWHRDTRILDKTLADLPPVVPPQSVLIWPSRESGRGLPLDDKSGLETILVLARREPIRDPRLLARLIGQLPLAASPLGEDDEFAVRGGAGPTDEAVRFDHHRGVQKRLEKIDEPLEKLMGRLGEEFELLRAVRFAHKGSK